MRTWPGRTIETKQILSASASTAVISKLSLLSAQQLADCDTVGAAYQDGLLDNGFDSVDKKARMVLNFMKEIFFSQRNIVLTNDRVGYFFEGHVLWCKG